MLQLKFSCPKVTLPRLMQRSVVVSDWQHSRLAPSRQLILNTARSISTYLPVSRDVRALSFQRHWYQAFMFYVQCPDRRTSVVVNLIDVKHPAT